MLGCLLLTLKVATCATLLSIVAGTALGYAGARRTGLLQECLDSLLLLPLVLPPTVLGYYLIVLFGRHSWLGARLEAAFGLSLMFTWQGAVVAAAVVSFPLVFRSARAAFQDVDPTCESAARTLGHSEAGVFFRVTLPLARRGILSGAMLAFARAFGEFGATLMIAGNLPGRTQTLSLAIYSAAEGGRDAEAAVLVALASAASACVLVASGRLLRPR